MAESLDITIALQGLLVEIHRTRDIDRKHQFKIDRRIGGEARTQRKYQRQRRHQKPQEQAAHQSLHFPPSRLQD